MLKAITTVVTITGSIAMGYFTFRWGFNSGSRWASRFSDVMDGSTVGPCRINGALNLEEV